MSNKKFTNHLINETSPYLLQHSHNPVNWFPWGEKALSKANEENKLLVISIGYSACHWCHVMERESFEDESIAKVMNENFVCIKVDREERPDIDHIYMNAVHLITGNGGWPLNCIALPDGRPVYGGTYFKPVQWKNILEGLAHGYITDLQKFNCVAEDLKKNIVSLDDIVKVNNDRSFNFEEIIEIILKLRKRFDKQNGGDIGAPKFPLPVNYFPLMRYYYHSGDTDILNQVNLTLNKLTSGGIYDHLGGGFARYSVDTEWLVPHFEKMLYDNAQLVSLFSEAYRLNPDSRYKKVIDETLEFIREEMMSPEGGFYSAYDADSEGEEGKYYVWDKYEVDSLLETNSLVFSDYYNISLKGNWEGRSILNINNSKENVAEKHNISVEKLDQILNESKRVLFNQRNKRIKPDLDDKILTSWNALMIKGYINAYKTFNNKEYLDIAVQSTSFIVSNLLKNDFSLCRNYKNGKSSINAFLDDYAFLIESLIELYQVTFNEEYIKLAKNLTEYVILHFGDQNTDMFNYTSDNYPELISRTKEISDNVIPSSNSVMAHNLYKLGHLFVNSDYIERAEQMVLNVKDRILKNPTYFGNWFDLMIQIVHTTHEVCIVGKEFNKVRIEFCKPYLPNVILAGGDKGELPLFENRYSNEGTNIYVCQNNTCNKPVETASEAFKIIQNS